MQIEISTQTIDTIIKVDSLIRNEEEVRTVEEHERRLEDISRLLSYVWDVVSTLVLREVKKNGSCMKR